VQTIPKSGYRLIGSVRPVVSDTAPATPPCDPEAPTARSEASGHSSRWPNKFTAFGAVLVLVAIAASMNFMFLSHSKAAAAQPVVLIAVLPFENLSGDPAQTYIADGMMEEVILQLGRLHPDQLGVIARASALTYRDSGKRIDQIGRELGVDYIIEGSVREDEHKLRVTANLIEVSTQRQIWGRSYEQDRKDLLAMQGDIARSVAQQIHLQVAPGQTSALPSPGTQNVEAQDEYLQGRFLAGRFVPRDVEAAIDHYRRAVSLDPDYAAPHAGLAEAYFLLGQPLRFSAKISPNDYLALCKAEATRAIQMDDNSGMAHSLLAISLFFRDWDWSGAESEFRKAVSLDPNSATTHIYYALYLTVAGKFEEARPHIAKAVELDPLQLAIVTLAAELHFFGRDNEGAKVLLRRVLEQDSNFFYARAILASVLVQAGNPEEAVSAFETIQKLKGASGPTAVKLRNAYSQNGMAGVYRFFLADGNRGPGHNFHQALFWSRLHDKHLALTYLNRAYRDHDSSLLFVGVHPAFDVLRDDARFQALRQKIAPSHAARS
jgi:TolB-like protein